MSLEYWEKLKEPPEWAMSKITGGKLGGKTDINPMWRIQAMTETFGPCGIGWKIQLVNTTITDGANGEKLIFVQIDLFINVGGKWSAPIPGFGGDLLVVTEKGRLVSNDEALKMAITDAMGNAMKNLGVAATVYSKGVDGTKYSRQSAETPPARPTIPANQNKPSTGESGAKSGGIEFKINTGTKDNPVYKMLTLDKVPAECLKQVEWYAANSQDEQKKSAAAEYMKKLAAQ